MYVDSGSVVKKVEAVKFGPVGKPMTYTVGSPSHENIRDGKIIGHPNTSGQLFTAEVELYRGYGVHSIVILH